MKTHQIITGILLGILIMLLIFLFIFKVLPEETKEEKFPNELTEEILEERIYDLLWQRADLVGEVRKVEFMIQWYAMELEAKRNNMTVQYEKIGDFVGRFEYDGSVIDNITIN